MNLVSRAAAVTLLLFFGITGRVWAQDAKNDPIFAPARVFEKSQPKRAIEEYQKIKGDYDRKNPEIAAEALLRAAQFAADPNRYVQTLAVPKPDAGAREKVLAEYSEQQGEGERAAHDAIKQLLQQYPTSKAALLANEPHYANGINNVQSITVYNDGQTIRIVGDSRSTPVANAKDVPQTASQTFKEAIEARIDQRNSKGLGYKIINGIVGMTGARPAFSYWFALVLIAFTVKLITLPLTLKTYRSQREMQRIQPQLKALNEKYKGKPEYQEKVMAFYKEHGINPLASCFPMLIQFPFLILVYNTIRAYEYHFVNGKFLWIGSSLAAHSPIIGGVPALANNLAQFDIPLLVLYAGSNYVTMKLTPAQDPQMAQQQKSMAVMMTFVMFYMFMTYKWSAAFILYWLALNIISAWQQYTYIYKPNKINPVAALEGKDTSNTSGPLTGSETIAAPTTKAATSKASLSAASNRPAASSTPIPGGAQMRPRPKRNKRK